METERDATVLHEHAEYHEDLGAVLWWWLDQNDTISEPPYCGQPGASNWPFGRYTLTELRWSYLPAVKVPKVPSRHELVMRYSGGSIVPGECSCGWRFNASCGNFKASSGLVRREWETHRTIQERPKEDQPILANLRAAANTLTLLGYSYHGGELWTRPTPGHLID